MLCAGYGSLEILDEVDISIGEKAIVALLGTNGAGKTTTLRALSGLIPSRGSIFLDGKDISRTSAAERARLGIAQIPQGRGTFTDFTVDENLRLGGYSLQKQVDLDREIERWLEVFPRLRERRKQLAGSLSGGEQQMLAIARALVSRPRVLLCDEPSLGLAPVIAKEVFNIIARLNEENGLAILVVEQNADITLSIAHYAYLMQAGKIVAEGSAQHLKEDLSVQNAYLGN
jgi:branched-chain amino acid transport system ATP-binding protein